MGSPNEPPDGKTPLGADLVIPALALGFVAYFFVSIADLAWEAKANGVLIGTILLSLIAVQLLRTAAQLVSGKASLGFERLWAPREALPKRLGLVLLTVAFIVAIRWLGLTLALFLALAAALYLMGVRKPARLAAVPLAVAGAAYLLFIVALDSDLPRGPVERLLGF
ncbi:MAG TPA: hypothetical protein VLD36_03635 [Burkholderiales bacterium]|nr:hypothetical protein [Burkholderiales bacterium]